MINSLLNPIIAGGGSAVAQFSPYIPPVLTVQENTWDTCKDLLCSATYMTHLPPIPFYGIVNASISTSDVQKWNRIPRKLKKHWKKKGILK